MAGEDRYGYDHRDDQAHDIGDSMPGDVGDSKGTFHDRARQDSKVVVDGKVQSIETHQRSSKEANQNKTKSGGSEGRDQSASNKSVSQDELVGKVVNLTIDKDGGTLETMARYKNHQVHIEGGTPGESIRVRLKKGQGFLIGERINLKE